MVPLPEAGAAAVDEALLLSRLRELSAADPSQGYRALHAQLRELPGLEQVPLKKVQTALRQLREDAAAGPPPPARRGAGPGENIWTAASDGDVARVEELIELEGLTPTSGDENGYTAVHAAAAWGRVDLLRLLLERAASAGAAAAAAAANVADSDGDTPLHHVAGASELDPAMLREIIDLLMAHGAEPGRTNEEGKSCLDVCGEDVLDEEGGGEQEINMEFVKAMAERGFELEAPDEGMEQ